MRKTATVELGPTEVKALIIMRLIDQGFFIAGAPIEGEWDGKRIKLEQEQFDGNEGYDKDLFEGRMRESVAEPDEGLL